MNIEKDLIISVLKLTKEESVSQKLINKDAKIASQVAGKLLQKLQNDGLIYVKKDIIETDSLQRLKLTVRAINLGADLERVSCFLRWQEFEKVAALALTRNGYVVEKNLHFRHAGRRYEIDIIGFKRPIAICIDCKHWRHGLYPSVLKRIVKEQVERTSALTEVLPTLSIKIEYASWERVKFVPMVLSLVVGRFKFYDNVPIVPVLQLQDFLSQLPAYVDSLTHFTKQYSRQLSP